MSRPRVVALVSGFGWHVEDLARAARDLGIAFEPALFSSLTGRVGTPEGGVWAGSIRLDDLDGVLVRMMPPAGLEPVVFRMDALHRLEAAGVPILNPPRAVEAAVDKYLALARIDRAGLPVPPTWVGESAADAMQAFGELGEDVVVKPLFGSEGRGIVRVTDPEIALRVFRALEAVESVIYVQKYLRHDGTDARLFVLGGRVIGSIRRHAPPGEWRANVALGAKAEAFDPDLDLQALAVRAARAVGAIAAGVDLLHDLDRPGWVVIEVNAVPGWRALAAATGVDVAAELLQAVVARSRR